MRGCSTATALLSVAVKTIAMPANRLSEGPLVIVIPRRGSDITQQSTLHHIHLPSDICDERHSVLPRFWRGARGFRMNLRGGRGISHKICAGLLGASAKQILGVGVGLASKNKKKCSVQSGANKADAEQITINE